MKSLLLSALLAAPAAAVQPLNLRPIKVPATPAKAQAYFKAAELRVNRAATPVAVVKATKLIEASPAVLAQGPDSRFAEAALDHLQEVELTARHPSVRGGVKAAIALAEAGGGALFDGAGANASRNVAAGVLAYTRLVDPGAKRAARTVSSFKAAFAAYEPDATYVDMNGWDDFFLGVAVAKRGAASGNKELEDVGRRYLNDYRLVAQRLGGSPLVKRDAAFAATLKTRFALLSTHYRVPAARLETLRREALAAVAGPRPVEELSVEALGLALETGLSPAQAASVILAIPAEAKGWRLDSPELAAAARLVISRGLSPEQAADLVAELKAATAGLSVTRYGAEMPNIAYRQNYTFLFGYEPDQAIMLALLTDAGLAPDEIARVAQAALEVHAKSHNDYGASGKAASALARYYLESMRWSPAAKLRVARAFTASRS